MTLNAQMFCRRTRLGGCQTLGGLCKSPAQLWSPPGNLVRCHLPPNEWGLLAHSDIELTQVPKQAIDLSEDVKRVSILNQAASLPLPVQPGEFRRQGGRRFRNH